MSTEATRKYFRNYARQWRALNPERSREINRKSNRALREKVIAAYGNVCACCGETAFEFLALDHINEDGAAHRKEIGHTGQDLCRWAVINDFPDTLQLLCHNCNLAKSFYGRCPHVSL